MTLRSTQYFHAVDVSLKVTICASYMYRGVSIKMASHVFYLELELLLRSILGPLHDCSTSLSLSSSEMLKYLESQVLKEVSSAVGLICFCS